MSDAVERDNIDWQQHDNVWVPLLNHIAQAETHSIELTKEIARLEQALQAYQRENERLRADNADWYKGVELIRSTLERWFGYESKVASPAPIAEFLLELAALQEEEDDG